MKYQSFKHLRNVVKRNGGLVAHIKLEYIFWKIGRDKYVKMSRSKLWINQR